MGRGNTVQNLGAGTVVKFLASEVIPWFGIATQISSDNGSAFILNVVKLVLQALKVKQRCGCVYHPRSQGVVERINRTLKAKLNNIRATKMLDCIDALPLTLMSCRMQTNRITCLTPHKMLTGRPMSAPKRRDPYKGLSLEQLQVEIKQPLTLIHKSIYVQEKQKTPELEQEEGPIKLRDKIYGLTF